MDKTKKRLYIQALGALTLNGKLSNFFSGKIYQGQLKSICVPALNCYSCPGALGSCPIGSLQALLSNPRQKVVSYLVGTLLLYGLLLGRWFCGFLCPFGFFQDLLSGIKKRKFHVLPKIEPYLRNIKYLVLLIFVIAMPILTSKGSLPGIPGFCKFLCPSGTLFAGLPLLGKNPILQTNIGSLFYLKLSLAIFTCMGALLIPRFFCRYICPLGGLFGLLNPFSLYHMVYDKTSCIQCKKCKKNCPMAIDPTLAQNSPECIRCKECVYQCPTQSLFFTFHLK